MAYKEICARLVVWLKTATTAPVRKMRLMKGRCVHARVPVGCRARLSAVVTVRYHADVAASRYVRQNRWMAKQTLFFVVLTWHFHLICDWVIDVITSSVEQDATSAGY